LSTELRESLASFLEADPVIEELATGGVWYEVAGERAEEKADPPYVVFSKVPSTPLNFSFQGNSQDWEVWIVKGVGPVKVAEEIDKRCRELLTDAEFEVVGHSLEMIRPFSDINYPELADGERYQHVGAQYRIINERSE
jgi:hypothetical protein